MRRYENGMARKGLLVLTLVMLTLVAASAPPSQVQAQGRTCFPETGYCVEGAILSYWHNNGGLSVFGYPITELRTETIEGWTGPVQWFERDRLEDHGAQGVMAGRLGARILELNNTPWHTYQQVSSAPAGCTYFEQTGHSLCAPFNLYWMNHGGLERFGYPITEAHQTTIGNWTGTVQYFERRRMEHHIENAGTPYEILLGRLGEEVLDRQSGGAPPVGPGVDPGVCSTVMPELMNTYTSTRYRDELGCVEELYTDRSTAIQDMQNGQMLWIQLGEATGTIFAMLPGANYNVYQDTWTEDMPDVPDVSIPGGLYPPHRGFGKVWIENMDLRNAIGWAVEPIERPAKATIQVFENGLIIWVKDTGHVYVFAPSGWEMFTK